MAGDSKQLAQKDFNPNKNFRTGVDATCMLYSAQGVCKGGKSDTYNCGIHGVELSFRVWCLVLAFAVHSVSTITSHIYM